MFIGGSALESAKAPSERLSDLRRRVAVAERAIKDLQAELDSARESLEKEDIYPRPQGWY